MYYKLGKIPWDPVAFWEHYSRSQQARGSKNYSIFFQRIGFSYRFIHRDLRDYIERHPPDKFKLLD